MKKTLYEYALLLLGSFIYSIGIAALLVPAKIGIGGVTGIALVLNKFFGFRIGITTIIINIPLFIFGYRIIGSKFAFRSAISVFTYSMLVDFIDVNFKFTPLNDVLLSTIFCGAIFGLGLSLIFIGEGSTGGLDISAKILVHKYQDLRLSNVMLIQDFIIYILVAFALGLPSVMYALIMSFIKTRALDTFQEGISSSKQCIIICQQPTEIIHEIQKELIRGVTVMSAEGAFSHEKKTFLYVVIQKNELAKLKKIVRSLEPRAFITVSSVSDIQGNFRHKGALN